MNLRTCCQDLPFFALILHIDRLMLVNKSCFKNSLFPIFRVWDFRLSVNGGEDAVF
jgi:hypothetical protein